mmetsp:Transcript_7483/g.15996  ORF Transcript_7483/g.15996 Transcript_7483/m.15996 type:complete len:209 (-) Transcript_7483:1099-1725(-)
MVEGDGVVGGGEVEDEFEDEDVGEWFNVAGEGVVIFVFVVGGCGRGRVNGHAGFGAQFLQKGIRLLYHIQRVGGFLQDDVKLPQILGNVVHNVPGPDLAQNGLPARFAGVKSQESRHPGHFLLGDIVFRGRLNGQSIRSAHVHSSLTPGLRILDDIGMTSGNAEGCQQDGTCLHRPRLGAHGSIVLLAQTVVLVPGEGVKEVILRNPK